MNCFHIANFSVHRTSSGPTMVVILRFYCTYMCAFCDCMYNVCVFCWQCCFSCEVRLVACVYVPVLLLLYAFL